jgi:hypothetical protein
MQGIFPKTGRGRRRRGDMKTMQKQDGCKCFLTAWQDTKPVHILHSFKTAKQTCMRIDKSVTPMTRRGMPQPTIVEEYNHGMRGTDGLDQLVSYYRNEQRTKKWQPRVFTHFLHIAVSNAHILYKGAMHVDDRSHPLFTLLNFTEQLIAELCEDIFLNRQVPRVVPESTKKRTSSSGRLDTWLCDESRLIGSHFPLKIKRTASSTSDPRKQCKVCGTRCSVECEACGVALCIDKASERTCFSWFHTAAIQTPGSKRPRKI